MEASDLQRRRRNRLRRAPRLLSVAAFGRWPRPLGALLIVLVAAVVATIWEPLLWVAAAVWGLAAAAAVLDAGLRGKQGVVAGLVAVVFGPLGASITALFRRRAIRKVADEEKTWLTAFALVMLLIGFMVGSQAIAATLREGPHGVDVPRAAMGDRVMSGDRVLVVPSRMSAVGRGDVVAISRFKGVDEALGISSGIAGVGRIVGLQGEVIGAIGGLLYICERLPDAVVGLQTEDGCENPSELAFLKTPTPDFGPIEIPVGTIWVMSDDRSGLIDSRVYGPVPQSAIVGRVAAVLTPLARIRIL